MLYRRKVIKRLLEQEIKLKTTQVLLIFHIIVGIVTSVTLLLFNSGFFTSQRHFFNANIATIFLTLLSGTVSIYCGIIRIFSIDKIKNNEKTKIAFEHFDQNKPAVAKKHKFLFLGGEMRKLSKKTSLLGKFSHTTKRAFLLSALLFSGTNFVELHGSGFDLISLTNLAGNFFYFVSFACVLVPLILEKIFERKEKVKNDKHYIKLAQWHFVVIMFIGHTYNYLRTHDIVKDIVLKNGLTILPGGIIVCIGLWLHLIYSCIALRGINIKCSELTQSLAEEVFHTDASLLLPECYNNPKFGTKSHFRLFF